MSATSGIGATTELTAAFSAAVESKNVRFIKVSIVNEALIPDLTIPISGTLLEDLEKLQSTDVLKDDVPAYVLTKLDDPPADWLAIFYVPDTAKVRDKMLYASSRAPLIRSLGSTTFTDSLFATDKTDITPDAYKAHLRSKDAPKPMSAQEKEMEQIKATERQTSGVTYEGSHMRSGPVGWTWGEGVEDALRSLDDSEESALVVLKLDTKGETLLLDSASNPTADELGSKLPQNEPCYAFFAWPHSFVSPPRRDIVFVYSCPPQSPVKFRMMYSSGCLTTPMQAKPLFAKSNLLARKVETSEPHELNENYLKDEFGFKSAESRPVADENKPFARPKGPPRRR